VIDKNSNTMYVMVYNQLSNGSQQYKLHALDLGSLTDKVAPAVVPRRILSPMDRLSTSTRRTSAAAGAAVRK